MTCSECGSADIITIEARGWTVCVQCGATVSGPVVIRDNEEKETE